jgi:hypothetical protein
MWGNIELISCPLFSELLEVKLRLEAAELFALELGDGLALGEAVGHGFAGHLAELGFVIEGLQMGRSPRHVQMNHPLRFGGKMKRVDDPFGG